MCFSLSLGIGGALILNTNSTEKVEASSYSASTVTKNLNLNDASESTIRNYYSNLNSLSASERQGTNLLKNLKPILKNNQKFFSYGGSATTAVWQIYEIVDRDWEKSPASSIPGYNANTNTITNYTYGTSNSNVGSNPYVHALYVNRDVDNQTRAWGNHDQDDWGINQEHVWAKSCGFDDKSTATGARGDVMHLWAGNGRVNGQFHSNYYYGFVDKTKSYTDAGKDKMNYTNLTGNLTGFSKTFGGSNTVFEPQDSDKGDIARAIFYMAARYNYYSGSDSDGIDAGNPNLVLVNNVSSWSNNGYTSSTSTQGKMGILQDLLEWNRIDPPDEWEIHRNNLCYNNFTNNRNPFIDFPEWAEYIWGSSNNGNYNSTVTGYAVPQTNLINNFASQVSGSVSISDVNKRITAGENATISATSSDNSMISWTSSNTNVATVSSATSASGANITINAIAAGNATITARATIDDKVYSKTCEVTVVSPASGDENTSSITVASYASANSWANGVKYTSLPIDSNVTASVNDGGGNTGKYYTSGNEWRFYQSETAKIEFSAAEGYVIDKLTVNYNVANNGALYDMSDNQIASGTEYNINSSDVIYQIKSTSGTSGQIKFTSFSVTYHQVQQVTLSSITLDTSNVQTIFTTGDTFNHSGLVVTAHYSDASTEIVSPSSVSEPDFQEESGTITIIVNYLGKTATYDITLITSISASANKTYKVGDVISTSDITVVDNEDNEIDNFVFAEDGYVFTYEDANSGGSATDKVFEVSFGNLTTDLTVSVSRETPTVSNDTLNYSLIGVSGTTYKDWDNKQSNSNAIYSGRSAGGNTAIQLRSSGSVEGIVQTSSGGIVASVEVTWNSNTADGRKINIYGKNTAYSAASDLFGNNAGTLIGSITYNSTTKLTITDSYAFIGIRSNSGALYLDEIVINYCADAKALSNFLMYEDTNNQCLTKLDDAIDMFNKLSSSDRESFMTSDEYVIETARERFEAWLVHEEKEISYSAGDYTIVDSRALLFDVIHQDSQLPTYILITIASISMASIIGYFYLRKKKEN